MEPSIKIIDAYPSKQIPERFLTNANQQIIGMFENQICVKIQSICDSYRVRYECDDDIKIAFLAKVDKWVSETRTDGVWAAVTHGSYAQSDYDFISTIGVIFSKPEDATGFMRSFVLLEKLKED